ncbi:hypothetical protein D3C84_1221500 [compost metagenome]
MPPSREKKSYMLRPTLMRKAPRSFGLPCCLWVRNRSGADSTPEKVLKMGMVVCSGLT